MKSILLQIVAALVILLIVGTVGELISQKIVNNRSYIVLLVIGSIYAIFFIYVFVKDKVEN